MLGRKLRTKLDLIRPKDHSNAQKEKSDRNPLRTFKINDTVTEDKVSFTVPSAAERYCTLIENLASYYKSKMDREDKDDKVKLCEKFIRLFLCRAG